MRGDARRGTSRRARGDARPSRQRPRRRLDLDRVAVRERARAQRRGARSTRDARRDADADDDATTDDDDARADDQTVQARAGGAGGVRERCARDAARRDRGGARETTDEGEPRDAVQGGGEFVRAQARRRRV